MASQHETNATSSEAELSDLVCRTSELTLSNPATGKSDESEPLDRKPSIDELLTESFDWLRYQRNDNLEPRTLSSWVVLGEKKLEFDDKSKYGDPELIQKLSVALKEMDRFDDNELRKVREKVNPLEGVKRAFFVNRSAVKFANIDSLMNYMFSNPVDKRDQSLIQPNEIMYFVDIGGGPGGFVDYLLWRRNWLTKGFGFELRSKEQRYYPHRFVSEAQRFSIYSGCNRDGDVTNYENVISFTDYVKKHVSVGVHIVIADCAFGIDERKYAKETIFKRWHLGEIIMALSVLRPNGHFILKLYDVFLPFTVGLVYLMYRCFGEICLIKPKSCRPSNSERYLICKWKNSNTESVREHLVQVNEKIHDLATTQCDIVELVPENVLLGDIAFYNFLCRSNNLIGEIQLDAILKIINESWRQTVESLSTSDIARCLEKWNIQQNSKNLFSFDSEEFIETVVYSADNLLTSHLPLDESFNVCGDRIGNEWHCIPIGNTSQKQRTFYTTIFSSNVKMFDRENSNWVDVPDIVLEFPVNTLLYGEIVYHHGSERDGKRSIPPHGFHIIDGVILNGQDIRSKSFSSRFDLCQKFATAINNPSRYVNQKQIAAIYCKESFPLRDIIPYIENFRKQWKTIRNGSRVLGLNVQTPIGPRRFYQVKGLLFLRDYPKIINETNFTETFGCRQLWSWNNPPENLNTIDLNRTPADEFVYMSHFCDYLGYPKRLNLSWRQSIPHEMPSKHSYNRGKGKRGFKR